MRAIMSLLGMYNYQHDILDDFVIPDGLNREMLIGNLLAETAELELLYSDADFMKLMVGMWSKKELPIWEKLKATTEYDYNPIWNTDAEYTTIDKTTTVRNEIVDSNSKTSTNTEYYTDTNNSQDRTDTLEVSAFNDGLEDAQKNIIDGEGTESTSADSSGNTNSDLNSNTDENTQVTYEHRNERHGNIGVTTTQSMIKEERDVVKFNIIDFIIDSFKNRFCILVY